MSFFEPGRHGSESLKLWVTLMPTGFPGSWPLKLSTEELQGSLAPKDTQDSHIIMTRATENTGKILEGTVRSNDQGKARKGLCKEVT